MNSSATAVRFDDNSMRVELSDGRTLVVPFAWFPRLLDATKSQLEEVKIGRFGLHWEAIDEDISIEGLLAGRGDQTVKKGRPIWRPAHSNTRQWSYAKPKKRQ